MFERFRFGAKRARDEEKEASSAAANGSDAESEVLGSKRSCIKTEPQPEPAATAPPAIVSQFKSELPLAPKWQERWHAICTSCFESHVKCDHFQEQRLRLLIVGHNPSDHAWESGFSYSNPTNRFWNLLRGSLSPLSWRGILPTDAQISEQNILPSVYGVGMTSIGLEPGNDAASYGRDTSKKLCLLFDAKSALPVLGVLLVCCLYVLLNGIQVSRWRSDFFQRLRNHVKQVCINTHGTSLGHDEDNSTVRCTRPHSPMVIAFSGKRQFSYLFSPPLAKVENCGRQTKFPTDWPRECLRDCEVWVLPSSSGRAAMTTAQRALPYQQLADRFHELPWPETATASYEDGLKQEQ